MVDVEDTSVRLRNHQLQLQRRIEKLETGQKNPSLVLKNQQMITAELGTQVGEIEADVRRFSGRMTELQRQLSDLENRVELESSRTKDRLKILGQASSARGFRDGSGREDEPDLTNRSLSPAGEQETPLSPRAAFNLAYNDYLKGNYNVAVPAFDAFIKRYPESRLVPQAIYWKGEIFYSKASYEKALDFFNKVIDSYPKSEKVSKALLKAGFSYLELNQAVKGRRSLEQILLRFPDSNEASLSRDTLDSLGKTAP